MKRLFPFLFVVFVTILTTGLVYQSEIRELKKQEQTKKRYKDIHRLATDAEIEAYEYIFEIPCDSTCYH